MKSEKRGFNEVGAQPMALMTLINCSKDGDQPLCTSHGNTRNLEEVLLSRLSPSRYVNTERNRLYGMQLLVSLDLLGFFFFIVGRLR